MFRARQLILWIAVGVVAAATLFWAFPRAFPLFPSGWQVSKYEAENIAFARLADLGELPPGAYVLTYIDWDLVLENRLQEAAVADPTVDPAASRLGRAMVVWSVRVYAPGAPSNDWSYHAEISPDGEVVDLQLRVPPGEPGEVLAEGDAIERSRAFLTEQGFDLAQYEAPEVRIQQLGERSDLFLRYRDRERLLGDDYPYGVEVGFAGDRLTGYSFYFDDPQRSEILATLQTPTLLQQVWVFLPLVLLPLVAVPFLRLYHAGEIGVRRGVEIALAMLGCGVVVMAFCGPIAGAGWNFGVLTRPQVTWVIGLQMVVLFFSPMALMSLLSWSVGEWYYRDGGGRNLAAFDALFQGKWLNSTFAAASLRGLVSGLALTATTMAIVAALRPTGAWASTGLLMGPWWDGVSWFSIPLVLFALCYALYVSVFGRLLLVSVFARWLGRWGGSLLAIVLGGLLFFPSLFISPLRWSLVLWWFASAVLVFLFLRYGLYTATLAFLAAFVSSNVIGWLGAADPSLQLHSSLALLAVAAPLIVSARHLLAGRVFEYRYEDIPPHVRRIADRERQKVELETARRIQTSILPELPPAVNGVQMSNAYLPATEVGGDFYDVLALEDGRLAVAVGDVAGHGVSSGLVMSMAKSALAVQVTFDPEVEAVFATLNRMVYQSARKRLLATLCYALIDPKKREMYYASAGHLFPYRLSRDGEVVALESVSYPLGVRDQLDVRVRASKLDPGDRLILFSDGVVEGRAEESDELYGFERLERSLARHASASVEGLRDGILEDLGQFTGNAPREDDLTLLILQVP